MRELLLPIKEIMTSRLAASLDKIADKTDGLKSAFVDHFDETLEHLREAAPMAAGAMIFLREMHRMMADKDAGEGGDLLGRFYDLAAPERIFGLELGGAGGAAPAIVAGGGL
jgi:hypothetical protein